MRNFFSNTIIVSKASVLLAFAFLMTADLAAQQKGVEPDRLAVDTVSVRKLGRVHGIVLSEDDRAVSVAVRRSWLQKTFPEFAKEHFAGEEKQVAKDRETIKKRLESWRGEYENDDRRVIDDFVDENIELLGLDAPIEISKLQFTIVKFDRKRVRRTFKQGEDRHFLAGIGWSENLEGVETTNVSVLKRQLVKKAVDIENYELNLGGEIPISLEPDEDWHARKSLIEFGLLSRVEFQGSNGVFLRRGAELNPAEALKSVMQGGIGGLSQIDQLGKELGLPEFQDRNRGFKQDKDAWLRPMIKAAEKEKRRCFSVAKMTQGQTVTVDMLLYHKVGSNQWVPLATFSNSESVADQTADDADAIAQDPNVKRIVEMAGQFGFGDQSALELALKNGAATRKALGKSMADLNEFVENYSFEIDTPPIENRQ